MYLLQWLSAWALLTNSQGSFNSAIMDSISDEERCQSSDDEECPRLELLQRRAHSLSLGQSVSEEPVAALCADVPTCAPLNLTGYCCPAPTGKNLDCCLSSSYAEKRRCFKEGRVQLKSCPPHVEPHDLTTADVIAMCQADCKRDMLELTLTCSEMALGRKIERMCSKPDQAVDWIRNQSDIRTCLNQGLQKSTSCPGNARIIWKVIQQRSPNDLKAVCSSQCQSELMTLTSSCQAKKLKKHLLWSCSNSTQPSFVQAQDDDDDVEEVFSTSV
jgi:hypothetical protein